MPNYDLIDGEEQNRRTPETFEIPPENVRKNISDGGYVKLGFATTAAERKAIGHDIDAERMWVQVTGREAGTDTYYGKLANDPAVIQRLRINDEIQFEAKNILSTE